VASGQAGTFDPAADAAAEAEGSTDVNKGQRSRYVVSLAKAILETVDQPIGAPLVVGIEHGNQGRNQVKGAMIGRSLVSDRLGKAAFRTSYQRNLTLFSHLEGVTLGTHQHHLCPKNHWLSLMPDAALLVMHRGRLFQQTVVE
jgi:hypothetical protein